MAMDDPHDLRNWSKEISRSHIGHIFVVSTLYEASMVPEETPSYDAQWVEWPLHERNIYCLPWNGEPSLEQTLITILIILGREEGQSHLTCFNKWLNICLRECVIRAFVVPGMRCKGSVLVHYIDGKQSVTDVYIDLWHCNVTGIYSGAGEQVNIPMLLPTVMELCSLTEPSRQAAIAMSCFVEWTSPSTSNTQQLTENEDDSISVNTVSGTSRVDPTLEYNYLGNSIFDKLLLW
ncbi:uncharacterized protein BT62DRAFT_994650 [Guyanagaster necrorhizus]|uniref:Uncharacterized protein n=1 Tax=Guyanagaster necrorhizus TaxID=856835 RepID=A0A9P7VRQ0_9AGAR|nr:uncharacterized protein BT62DRAFT_994650 [Guyanagaster necrorhizus MCA 3950]KAG7445689.1 hypothetical protein BT62DRAFT_994650 [Guyanagaster necrorhizus MCA 3950]